MGLLLVVISFVTIGMLVLDYLSFIDHNERRVRAMGWHLVLTLAAITALSFVHLLYWVCGNCNVMSKNIFMTAFIVLVFINVYMTYIHVKKV